MSVSQDELMYLQSQLEGLESIFLELMPFGVELKRQQVQDYYDKRFDSATKPVASVAENELMVAGGMANHINGRPLAVGYLLQERHIVISEDQPHTFLRFIAGYLFGRQGRITNWEFIKMNDPSGGFNEFR